MTDMSDPYLYWNCQNKECECTGNPVKKTTIDDAIRNNTSVRVFCGICGFSPAAIRLDLEDRSGSAAQACNCIPFTGDEARLPLRRTSTGMYVDASGTKRKLIYFLRMGIDPDNYLKWIEFNKKPNHIDLRQFF